MFSSIFSADDNDKLSVLPASTSGSLSSITTTSVASSEPDPGVDGNGDGENDGGDNKSVRKITTEKWWQTTLQVSIPFLIAGIGTIGAGIILGRVEVRGTLQLKYHYRNVRHHYVFGKGGLRIQGDRTLQNIGAPKLINTQKTFKNHSMNQ